MKKIVFLMAAVVLFNAVGLCWALEDGLDVDVSATWVTKYIWRGIDKLDDKAAFQPSINFDLYDTGFSFNVWASMAGASKNGGAVSTVDAEEWNYTLTYADAVFEGEQYKTNYAVSWMYYDYPDTRTKDNDMQEFNLAMAWPDLCPAGVVPSYSIIRMWAARSDGLNNDAGGFIHVFGLGYDYTVPGFLPDNPEQTLNFAWNIVYNDGTGAAGGVVDHDWSHMLWGVSTDISCPATGGRLTPALYYQTSMEDTVNDQDEFWFGLTYGFSF